MIVHKIGNPNDPEYPYQYRVDLEELLRHVDRWDISDWLKANDLKCSMLIYSLYLHTEEDLSMFLLRWA
jgi:hypothetical protein